MKMPVRDRRTQPYVSEPEIPAVKLALSAWRASRRDRAFRAVCRDIVAAIDDDDSLRLCAAAYAAGDLERLALIDRRIAATGPSGPKPA